MRTDKVGEMKKGLAPLARCLISRPTVVDGVGVSTLIFITYEDSLFFFFLLVPQNVRL